MEENQNRDSQVSSNLNQGSGISFPTPNQQKQSGGPKMLLIIGILILVAVLGFVIYKSATGKNEVVTEPTPFDNTAVSENQIPTPFPTPTSTPKTSVDKSTVKIQVQNGTGITGEAAYLEGLLKVLGYSDIKVGNASGQAVEATTVTFSSTLEASVVSEITQKLNAIYQSVTVKTTASATFDVVVVTGLRKGSTSKPSATPTSTPKATSTPAATP